MLALSGRCLPPAQCELADADDDRQDDVIIFTHDSADGIVVAPKLGGRFAPPQTRVTGVFAAKADPEVQSPRHDREEQRDGGD